MILIKFRMIHDGEFAEMMMIIIVGVLCPLSNISESVGATVNKNYGKRHIGRIYAQKGGGGGGGGGARSRRWAEVGRGGHFVFLNLS